MPMGEGCPPGPSSPRSVADAVADAHQQREQLGRRRPPHNIATLLREREILHGRRAANVRHEMLQWSTACWMRGPTHKSDYCNIAQAKSTIALAFSPDGELFASTHGDHTVKVFVCATWKQLCVLSGHERTPWTVKFHPSDKRIIASGSLDQTVRVWDITTRQTIRRHQFHFVVSCISFHSSGKFLAVTASKRISLWEWEGRDDAMDTDDAPAAPPVRVLLEGEQPQRCAVVVGWPLPSCRDCCDCRRCCPRSSSPGDIRRASCPPSIVRRRCVAFKSSPAHELLFVAETNAEAPPRPPTAHMQIEPPQALRERYPGVL